MQQNGEHSNGLAARRGWWGECGGWWGVSDVTALLAFLLLIVMLLIGARVHGVRDSFWKFLAFITACVVVLALLLAILAK